MHAAAAQSSPGAIILSLLLWMLIIAWYWVPTWIALARNVPAKGQVVILNFFGFTVVCWVIALVLAFREGRPRRQVPPPWQQQQLPGPWPRQ